MGIMVRIEMHCHSSFSKDSLVPPEKIVEMLLSKRIERVVITDHNTIAGALLARQAYPGQVIVGEEILTTRGELLAFFVEEELPAGLEPLEAIRRLRQQNAVISVSHPFDLKRHGWEIPDLEQIAPLVDAIEVFNARCLSPKINQQAEEFAQSHHLLGTVGSDAHTLAELGRATLSLPDFSSADELRAALPTAQRHTQLSSPFVHFMSTYAKWVKKINR
jgi:predicted metal-dependent phosphoesterase TrpH